MKPTPKDYDYLDLKTLTFIGGQLAKKDKRFQIYAQFGYQKAEDYAALESARIALNWIDNHKDKTPTIDEIITLAKRLIEEMGISELYPTLKELTRITMIKGDTSEFVPWKKQKKTR